MDRRPQPSRHCERSDAIQGSADQRWLVTTGKDVMKQPAVYIMASGRNGTLYVGVTSNLAQRVWQHREGLVEGFTKRYGCTLLIWCEAAETMDVAITREKQIKGGSRAKKLAVIEAANPGWRDLFGEIAHG